MVSIGSLEETLLILWNEYIQLGVGSGGGHLDPIHVYKESVFFSDQCIISLVVFMISVYYARALKFLENEFRLDLEYW